MEANVMSIIAIGSAIYALLSEVIGLNEEWESNSVIQVVMGVFKKLFTK